MTTYCIAMVLLPLGPFVALREEFRKYLKNNPESESSVEALEKPTWNQFAMGLRLLLNFLRPDYRVRLHKLPTF